MAELAITLIPIVIELVTEIAGAPSYNRGEYDGLEEELVRLQHTVYAIRQYQNTLPGEYRRRFEEHISQTTTHLEELEKLMRSELKSFENRFLRSAARLVTGRGSQINEHREAIRKITEHLREIRDWR